LCATNSSGVLDTDGTCNLEAAVSALLWRIMIGFDKSLSIVARQLFEGPNWWTGSVCCNRVLANISLAIKAFIWAFLVILFVELVLIVCCST
jgi:hypothetical protein